MQFSPFSAGVKTERLSEGLSPRHCALSLVGEPIMYPEINALVDELHRRHISTFLVTNAQFPDRIMMLKPITQVLFFLCHKYDIEFDINLYSQKVGYNVWFLFLWLQLYVSVDAATKDSLKAIDRPLFGDFWERFLVSICIIK